MHQDWEQVKARIEGDPVFAERVRNFKNNFLVLDKEIKAEIDRFKEEIEKGTEYFDFGEDDIEKICGRVWDDKCYQESIRYSGMSQEGDSKEISVAGQGLKEVRDRLCNLIKNSGEQIKKERRQSIERKDPEEEDKESPDQEISPNLNKGDEIANQVEPSFEQDKAEEVKKVSASSSVGDFNFQTPQTSIKVHNQTMFNQKDQKLAEPEDPFTPEESEIMNKFDPNGQRGSPNETEDDIMKDMIKASPENLSNAPQPRSEEGKQNPSESTPLIKTGTSNSKSFDIVNNQLTDKSVIMK